MDTQTSTTDRRTSVPMSTPRMTMLVVGATFVGVLGGIGLGIVLVDMVLPGLLQQWIAQLAS